MKQKNGIIFRAVVISLLMTSLSFVSVNAGPIANSNSSLPDSGSIDNILPSDSGIDSISLLPDSGIDSILPSDVCSANTISPTPILGNPTCTITGGIGVHINIRGDLTGIDRIIVQFFCYGDTFQAFKLKQSWQGNYISAWYLIVLTGNSHKGGVEVTVKKNWPDVGQSGTLGHACGNIYNRFLVVI